jgi:hypothetical protein
VARARTRHGVALAFLLGALGGAHRSAEQEEPPARARPHYERARALAERVRDSAGLAAASRELVEALDGWRGRGFGLEEPLDPDLTLASVTALGMLRNEPARAAELRHLLAGIAERRGAPPPADLALALARGWLALLGAPDVVELPPDEHVERLRTALGAVETLSPGEERDLAGGDLALAIHHRLRALGASREATESLVNALRAFPAPTAPRVAILCVLADERRLVPAWKEAGNLVREAEAVLRSLPEPVPALARSVAGVRCQLELACGLNDRALVSFQAERAARDAGARDPASQLSVLLDHAGVALATLQPWLLAEALAELGDVLADPGAFADRPDQRAQLRARHAMLADHLDVLAPRSDLHAERRLEEAFSDPALDVAHRATLGLRLVVRALESGDLAAAEDFLARLDPLAAAMPGELADALLAHRALFALATGEASSELEAHFAVVHAAYERFLDATARSPVRDGGLGLLAWRNRRVLLAALLDLRLAIDGDAGVGPALQLALRADALGSLARRLGCPTGAEAGDLDLVRSSLLAPGIGLLVYLPAARGAHVLCNAGTSVTRAEIEWG